MDRDEGRKVVESLWRRSAELMNGCSMEVDDSRTEEFEWGWRFYMVPVDRSDVRQNMYACDRTSGCSVPVGAKGIAYAVMRLMKFREAKDEQA